MTRDEFCSKYWSYYKVLESDFLETERYLTFDLGNNQFYNGTNPAIRGNSEAFSVEYIKQYQSICSEVDVILKAICTELNNSNANDMKNGYTPTVLGNTFWNQVISQKVLFRDIELQPFMNWSASPYKSPDWWTPYNDVKHKRVDNYKKANLKNVINALAGLFILENYLVKDIANKTNDIDVPNDVSHLFEMDNWETINTVVGRDQYLATYDDIEGLFKDNK